MYQYDRQDRFRFNECPPVDVSSSQACKVTAGHRGADNGIGGGSGPTLWQGGMPMYQRRTARALYLCCVTPDTGSHSHGICAQVCCRGCATRSCTFYRSTRNPSGDLSYKYRTADSAKAPLSGTGNRNSCCCGQHGYIGSGVKR